MGKSQRTKGASFEREVCHLFSAALGRKINRNIGQARDGGNDIDVGPFVVECKRRKTLGTVESWLAQANAAAEQRKAADIASGHSYSSYVPIVVGRSDGGSPIVVLALDDFLTIAEQELKSVI